MKTKRFDPENDGKGKAAPTPLTKEQRTAAAGKPTNNPFAGLKEKMAKRNIK